MNIPIQGVYTALVTPFSTDGNIDENALRKLIDFQIENGVSGLVPCGTTGESPTLSHEEHDQVVEITIDQAAKRVPIVAGSGSNNTKEAIRLSQHAAKAGADALLVVNPYYNKPTQKGLYLHFKSIADSVEIPCVLYNIKGRTGVNLETDTLVRLADECSNILAVKEASGDLNQMKDVIRRKKENFSVLSGDDNIVIDLIEAGGDGVVSVASNLFPAEMSTMVSTALSGDIEKARQLEAQLSDFFNALFIETNPIPIKTAMAAAGICQEVFRLPMCSLTTEDQRTKVLEIIKNLGVKIS